MTEIRQIGVVSVDSGSILICDPSYIDPKFDDAPDSITEFREGLDKLAKNSWLPLTRMGCAYVTCDSENHCGQLYHGIGNEGAGVATESGGGDGTYPVYAIFLNEEGFGRRVAGIFVDFQFGSPWDLVSGIRKLADRIADDRDEDDDDDDWDEDEDWNDDEDEEEDWDDEDEED